MKLKEYSDGDTVAVIKALCAVNAEEMKPAFNLFATGQRGKLPTARQTQIDSEHFRQLAPLLCEDLREEEIEALFRKADADASGLIDEKDPPLTPI